MQDLATLLSDILSYMTAGWRSRSRSVRWLVRGGTGTLVLAMGWLLWHMSIAP
jgi:hypothetical protein